MTLIYRILVGILLIFTIISIYKEEDIKKQLNNSLVVIPLLLRFLMIK